MPIRLEPAYNIRPAGSYFSASLFGRKFIEVYPKIYRTIQEEGSFSTDLLRAQTIDSL
ncbi:hypothetical protein LEP1GSC060_0295 [Leptospira weilii serovar Ranarum str. ICFT]|uniref:Uncharacterized protein n=1 Tax=Leptospira weilii serovar Ranarum str. ICFT TaxID=1218598 RepID=N1WHQ8_9LEPT|nr:hypothetical protein LEP1GSC060_0295 [Leptospira weilii serovar Ranarum str. ICFT]